MTNLNKRVWDRRILHVNLRPALRAGDVPSRIVDVIAVPDGAPDEADVTISDISLDGTTASFLVAGGIADRFYRLLIRFEVDSSPGQMIEAITGLKVK